MKELTKIELVELLSKKKEKKLLLTFYSSNYSLTNYLFNKLEINKISFLNDLKLMEVSKIEHNDYLNYYLIVLVNKNETYDTLSIELV